MKIVLVNQQLFSSGIAPPGVACGQILPAGTQIEVPDEFGAQMVASGDARLKAEFIPEPDPLGEATEASDEEVLDTDTGDETDAVGGEADPTPDEVSSEPESEREAVAASAVNPLSTRRRR